VAVSLLKPPHGRWSKATALFWCQNVYRELPQFHSQGTTPLRGGTLINVTDINTPYSTGTPPLPASPLPSYGSPEKAASSGTKGGQGATVLCCSWWLRGQVVGYSYVYVSRGGGGVVAYYAAPALLRSERAGPLSGLARPPEKRAAGASSERSRRLAPKSVVVIGGLRKNDLLILATS
jgi:hypothetical protein